MPNNLGADTHYIPRHAYQHVESKEDVQNSLCDTQYYIGYRILLGQRETGIIDLLVDEHSVLYKIEDKE